MCYVLLNGLDPACGFIFSRSLEPEFAVISFNREFELSWLAFILRDKALIKVKIEDALALTLI